MRPRQPLPRLWMMTDERQGDALWTALERLPSGTGVVFRHYTLDRSRRRDMLARINRVARRRGLILVAAVPDGIIPALRLAGLHNHKRRVYRYTAARGLKTASVHNMRELRAAEAAGADLVFISPVFPTHSHPGAETLSTVGFRRLARTARVPVVALGGMNEDRYRELRGRGAYGWAAIDAWTSSHSPTLRRV